MSAALIIQILEALAATVAEIAPLVAQGQSVLAQSDAVQIRAASDCASTLWPCATSGAISATVAASASNI